MYVRPSTSAQRKHPLPVTRPTDTAARQDNAERSAELSRFGQFARPLLKGGVKFGLQLPHAVTLNRLEHSRMADHPELQNLESLRRALETAAKKRGLDPAPVLMHVLPEEKFLQLAARNGFLERYPHWSWGQEYYDLKLPRLYGVKNFLEVVVNNEPVQAYLPDNYPAFVHKILMIHALARSDVYKNNLHFRNSNRRIQEQIAGHAEMIRAMGESPEIGKVTVEEFLDKVHSIRNLVDSSRPMRKFMRLEQITAENPERDILGFLAQNSKTLTPWQRDIVEMVRRESFASVPITKTCVLADGWSSFWNMKLNGQNPEFWDLSNMAHESRFMAEIFKTNPVKVNTYKLGFTIFKHLEKRFAEQFKDHPEKDRKVLEALKTVRRDEHDVSLLRKYLTKEMVEDLLMYTYDPKKNPNPPSYMGHVPTPQDQQKPGTKLHLTSRQFDEVRNKLIKMYENCGQPVIEVIDDNYNNEGSLYLRHLHEYDLKKDFADKTLINVAQLWGKRVYLDTYVTDDQGQMTHVLLSSDGQSIMRRNIR